MLRQYPLFILSALKSPVSFLSVLKFLGVQTADLDETWPKNCNTLQIYQYELYLASCDFVPESLPGEWSTGCGLSRPILGIPWSNIGTTRQTTMFTLQNDKIDALRGSACRRFRVPDNFSGALSWIKSFLEWDFWHWVRPWPQVNEYFASVRACWYRHCHSVHLVLRANQVWESGRRSNEHPCDYDGQYALRWGQKRDLGWRHPRFQHRVFVLRLLRHAAQTNQGQNRGIKLITYI